MVDSLCGPDEGSAVRVAIVSSVHRWNDTRVYVRQARSIAGAGYDVTLVAVASEAGILDSKDGLKIHPLPRRRPKLRWLNCLKIVAVVLRSRARIVHAHDPELFPILAVLRLFGRKTICDVHENVAEQILNKEWIPRRFRAALSACVRWGQKLLPGFVDHVILAEDSYTKNFPPSPNMSVVHNFPILPSTSKGQYRTDTLRMVYVGDVRLVRGIETYVRICAKLVKLGVPVELLVAGSFASQDERRYIEDLTRQLGVVQRVRLLGRVPPEEIPGLLEECDVGLALLHPIGNYRESYPTKMFEYMAAGLPVVVSDFELWRRVVVDNDCGYVLDPFDVDAAATIMCGYWQSQTLRERHGRNGRRAVVAHYHWGLELPRLLGIYSTLSGAVQTNAFE